MEGGLGPQRFAGGFRRVGQGVKDDGGGGVDGEGVDGVAHGDSNEKVEQRAKGGREAFALIAHKKSDGLIGQDRGGEESGRFWGGPNRKNMVEAKEGQEGIHAVQAENRNAKNTTHGSAGGAGVIGIGAAESENSRDTHGMRGTEQGTDIAWIHHFIQNEDFALSS